MSGFKTFYQEYKNAQAKAANPGIKKEELPYQVEKPDYEKTKRVIKQIKRDQLLASAESEGNFLYYVIGGLVAFKAFRLVWNSLNE